MIDAILFMTGLLAGIINAVAGGGVILVFGTMLYAGLSPLMAATTSIATVWPGAIMAVIGYRKDLVAVPKKLYLLVVPAITGSLIGASLLVRTPNSVFESLVPWLILCSILLFAFQPQLHAHIHKPAHLRIKYPFVLLSLLLLAAAFYGGYFGAGFGFIVLALLSFTHLKTVHQINGMKNLIAASIILVCAALYALHGTIAWEHVLAPTIGAAIGGGLGARLGHHLSPHVTRAFVISSGLIIVTLLLTNTL